MTFRTLGTRVGALAIAVLSVEVLSLGAVFPLAFTTTGVWAVLVSIIAGRLFLWADTFACVLVVDLALGTFGTGRGALAFAVVVAEVLSFRAVFLDADTATGQRLVVVSVGASRLVLGADTFTGVVVIQPACGAVRTRVGALTVAFLLVEILSFGAVSPFTDTVTSV